jgi:hypothetical protein
MNSQPPLELRRAMRMFVPGSDSTSGSCQHVNILYPDGRWVQLTENWSLRRRSKRSNLCSGMPRRDKVEDSESRSEWSCLDSTVVRGFLSQSDVHQGDENRCEDHYNNEGCSEGNDGDGHDRISCRLCV